MRLLSSDIVGTLQAQGTRSMRGLRRVAVGRATGAGEDTAVTCLLLYRRDINCWLLHQSTVRIRVWGSGVAYHSDHAAVVTPGVLAMHTLTYCGSGSLSCFHLP